MLVFRGVYLDTSSEMLVLLQQEKVGITTTITVYAPCVFPQLW